MKVRELLTEKEFKTYWKKQCYYCGDEIKLIGLDRKDNVIGYTINNIVPCCEVCNRMKMIMHHDDFIKQCDKIVNKSLSINSNQSVAPANGCRQ